MDLRSEVCQDDYERALKYEDIAPIDPNIMGFVGQEGIDETYTESKE